MNKIFISIGPFNIYYYSLTMLAAVLLALYITFKEAKRRGIYNYVSDLSFYVLISGIIGARLYYVIFNFKLYQNNLLDVFKIWEGGIAIYGAVIGGLIAIIYSCIKENKNILEITDIIAPGLIIAQAIGRWGNFFNKEAHGGVVSLEFLQKLHIPNFIIEGMNINGLYYHPTFLYESVWCLIGFILLLYARKNNKDKLGVTTYLYFIYYGIGRFLIESLRTDSLYFFNYKISQIVSIILVILGIIGLLNIKIRRRKNAK